MKFVETVVDSGIENGMFGKKLGSGRYIDSCNCNVSGLETAGPLLDHYRQFLYGWLVG